MCVCVCVCVCDDDTCTYTYIYVYVYVSSSHFTCAKIKTEKNKFVCFSAMETCGCNSGVSVIILKLGASWS